MRFSIIIPIYNVAPYIRECLDSVLGQTFADWEAICVDDGSTDGSGKMVDEFGARDRRFVVVHQQNAGVSVARNTALEKATGDWILMLDGDDCYDTGFLSRLDLAISNNPGVDCLAFSFECIDGDGRRLGKPNFPSGGIVSGDDILGECPGGNWRYVHACWDKAYRRSVIENYKLRFHPDIRLSEDTLFANKFFSICGSVVILEGEVGYRWRERAGSATHRRLSADIVADDLLRFKVTYEWWTDHRRPGLFKTLRFWASALPFLGKSFGCRDECVEILLDSDIFCKLAVPFLVCHGKVKAKMFALVYMLVPKFVKRVLLHSAFGGK